MKNQPLVNWSHSTQHKPDFGSGKIVIRIQQPQDTIILKESRGLLHEESDLFADPKFGAQFPGYSQPQFTEAVVLGIPTPSDWTRFPAGVNIISMQKQEVKTESTPLFLIHIDPPASPTGKERFSCLQLLSELPDSALPETVETLTELRDHYRSLENPSIRYPTPPPRENVKAEVLSVE